MEKIRRESVAFAVCITLMIVIIAAGFIVIPPMLNDELPDGVGGRFQYIRTEYTSDGIRYKLYVDTDTGVMYWNLCDTNKDKYGLTVLLDTDGKPLLWNGRTEVE